MEDRVAGWSTSVVVPAGTPPGSYAVNATCTFPSTGEVSARAQQNFAYATGTLTVTVPAVAVTAPIRFTG